MVDTDTFKTVLEEEVGKGWRAETHTRTLKVFSGGGGNRFTVEVEFEDGEYSFLIEDSVMSADSVYEGVDSERVLPEFRKFVSNFADSVRR